MNDARGWIWIVSLTGFAVAVSLLGISATRAQNEKRTAATAAIDDEALVGAAARPGDWLSHGRTYDEQRYSPLQQIDTDNVSELGLAWVYETRTNRGLEATPIVVDGVMYATGSWSVVLAIDAVTGEPLWTYDPEVPRSWAQKACCDVVNRGVAIYKGRVIVGTLDGRLEALDSETGELLWSTETIDPSQSYTITGAPRVVQGKVIIGNGGAEYGVRGYVSAYEATTGELEWRFYTVPGNPDDGFENEAMEKAAETWTGEWWNYGGGGTVWDSMAYDPDLDLLYIGVGNGSPWNQRVRSPGGGDNLYLSSIVALRPDTGEYVWHYQTTPGDTWDFTATQHIMLADLEIDGRVRKVAMQAPKNGFFYVLDRETGELISAENYVQVTWATGIDPETGRPIETPEARYPNGVTAIFPGPFGGHNWHPMAFSPGTGFVYIPAQEMAFPYGDDAAYEHRPGQWNVAITFGALADPITKEMVAGHLAAWDPVAQEEKWRVQYDLPWNGGVLATGGDLVFQGTPYGMLTAYHAKSGEKLWEMYTGSGVIAAPVSFQVGDTQYVSVLSGWGGAFGLIGSEAARSAGVGSEGRIVTFALGASGTPIERVERDEPRLAPVAHQSTSEQIDEGRMLFATYCLVCHGPGAVSGGVITDVRYSSPRVFDQYEAIVLEGRRENRGMPGFSAVIDTGDVMAIRSYILSRRDDVLASREP